MSTRITADNVKLKRAYESTELDDSTRVLIDRQWPRGVRKDGASVDLWLKNLVPSTEHRAEKVVRPRSDALGGVSDPLYR